MAYKHLDSDSDTYVKDDNLTTLSTGRLDGIVFEVDVSSASGSNVYVLSLEETGGGLASRKEYHFGQISSGIHRIYHVPFRGGEFVIRLWCYEALGSITADWTLWGIVPDG